MLLAAERVENLAFFVFLFSLQNYKIITTFVKLRV